MKGVRYNLTVDFYEEAKLIGNDRSAGASELVQRAVSAITRHNEQLTASEMADVLLQARRDMAPIINLALELKRHGNSSTPREIAEAFLHEHKRSFAKCVREIALIVSGVRTVMTFSRSSTVLAGLLQAKHAGGNFKVVLTEARPGLEGITLARELSSARLPVVVGPDASMAAFLEEADLVLVGADAVGPDVFFNKTGTLALARLCSAGNIPFYVCATRDKMLNSQGMEIYQVRNMPSQEIMHPVPEGVQVVNRYFEPVPTGLVTRFLGV